MVELLTHRDYHGICVIYKNLNTTPDMSIPTIWETGFGYDSYEADVWYQYYDGVLITGMLVHF